jgi:drug/metabolite transporter (DMT)-like permease
VLVRGKILFFAAGQGVENHVQSYNMQRIGELAAFGTAVSWTLCAIFFERGIKRIGVLAVNFYKVVIAFFLLTATAALFRGMPLPFDAPQVVWVYLSLSGVVGFVITDIFLFSAYGTVGPRITMLFTALSPAMTAGIAWLFLGETPGQRGVLGMALVIAGILMAVFGRLNGFEFSKISREDRLGYVFALVATLGQSIGIILTKIGVEGYDPVSGTQIRVFTAIIGFAIVSLFFHGGKNITKALKDFEGLLHTSIGAVFGPYLGVTLSLFAVQRVSAGVASTLIGLSPVLIIVPELLIFKKKIRALEIAGTVIAVAGTTIFFI